MPRYTTNKYPGTCVDCGADVAPGGRMWKSRGRWVVSHGGRCNAAPVANDHAPRRALLVTLNSGAELFQNGNGRCEDAPCCGCCNF